MTLSKSTEQSTTKMPDTEKSPEQRLESAVIAMAQWATMWQSEIVVSLRCSREFLADSALAEYRECQKEWRDATEAFLRTKTGEHIGEEINEP